MWPEEPLDLAVLREPLAQLLFMRGAFAERDAAMTVFALFCFSFGLAGQCLGPVLTRGFYALSCAKVVFRGSSQLLKGTGQVLPMVSKAQRHWWRWLLVGACLLAIAYFSGQPFAGQDLRPEIWRHAGLVERVRELPPVSFSYSGQPVDNRRAPADFIQFWLRKGAHVLLYGALGMALAAALGGTGFGSRRCWLPAGVIVVLVGVLDEWHQTFVPGRTGRAVDVLVDLAGFVVLVFFVWLIGHRAKSTGDSSRSGI